MILITSPYIHTSVVPTDMNKVCNDNLHSPRFLRTGYVRTSADFFYSLDQACAPPERRFPLACIGFVQQPLVNKPTHRCINVCRMMPIPQMSMLREHEAVHGFQPERLVPRNFAPMTVSQSKRFPDPTSSVWVHSACSLSDCIAP